VIKLLGSFKHEQDMNQADIWMFGVIASGFVPCFYALFFLARNDSFFEQFVKYKKPPTLEAFYVIWLLAAIDYCFITLVIIYLLFY
jgi:hypothetical protein